MNSALDKTASTLTSGFITIAIAAIILGIIAVVIGKKYGGDTKRKQKATASVVWAIGLLLIGIFLLPNLFK